MGIKPREGGDAGASAFEVKPNELVLAPHDSKQIQVRFTPTHLASFGAVLEAVVPQGEDGMELGVGGRDGSKRLSNSIERH